MRGINMEQSAVGFVSFQRMTTDDWLFKGGGKLAAIWFDRIVINYPDSDFTWGQGFLQIADRMNWSSQTLDEALQLFVPFDAAAPRYEYKRNAFDYDEQSYSLAAVKVVMDETDRLFPDSTDREWMREVSLSSAGLIEGLRRWMDLEKRTTTALLPTEREHRVLHGLSCMANGKEPFEVFSEVMEHNLPSVADMTWDEVIELRFHPFFKQFRRKICAVQALLSSGDNQASYEIVDEMKRKDLIEMAKFFRPNPFATVIRGIASNLPLPIPNLFSGFSAIRDVFRDSKSSVTHGWVHFLIDIEK